VREAKIRRRLTALYSVSITQANVALIKYKREKIEKRKKIEKKRAIYKNSRIGVE
jgi:hypothetical protein